MFRRDWFKALAAGVAALCGVKAKAAPTLCGLPVVTGFDATRCKVNTETLYLPNLAVGGRARLVIDENGRRVWEVTYNCRTGAG